MIFESHAHYDDGAFDADRDEILAACKDAGIEYIVNVSADLESVETTLALSKKWDFVYAAVGIHPDGIGRLDEGSISFLRAKCQEPKVVAVGEIGLDYHWDKENHEMQKYWFHQQLVLAGELGLPVIVHSRDAAADTMEEIKKVSDLGLTGVIHCFSYPPELAREYADMGYYIGVGGVVTFKNGRKLKEAVKAVPIEKILLETDCPYLSPEPFRGRRNSSLNLPYVAGAVADLKGITAEEVIHITCENAKRMYFRDKESI